MLDFFDFILDNWWILLILLPVVSFAVSIFTSMATKSKDEVKDKFDDDDDDDDDDDTDDKSVKKNKKEISLEDAIGDEDNVTVEHGYYRYQKDNQIVITRTKEQQRIFDEYFVVKNIKNVTCDSSLKEKSQMMKIISIILFALGVIVALMGLGLGKIAIIAGLCIVVIGGGISLISSSYKKKYKASIKATVAPKKIMTDDEFEKLVDKKIKEMNVEKLGMERLGIDTEQVKEITPIVLRDKVVNERSLRVYNKETGTLHSSTQYVTMLYFTDEELFVYKIQFDMCCNMQDEWTSEFFYKDICDISSHTYKNVLKFEGVDYEYSTVSFSIIASNSSIGFDLDGNNENVGSIQAMKQKIREKKMN